MAMNSLASLSLLSICLFLHFLLLSLLFFSTNIHTKEEGRKSKNGDPGKEWERKRERKGAKKYQEEDEEKVGMVVMTQYNRVAIRNVTLPSDQLSRPSLLYSTLLLLLPLTTRFVSVTIFSLLALLLTWVSSIFLYSKPLGSGSLFYPNQFFFFFFFFPRLETWIVSDDIDLLVWEKVKRKEWRK